MQRRRAIRVVVGLALSATLVAACGGDDDDDSAADATTSSSTAPADDTTTSTPDGTDATFTVALASTPLGDVLVDADGKTLYVFDADGEGTSACNAGCDTTWPPLVVTGEIAVSPDLDAANFTTIDREDGSTQVAVGGRPLYTYAADAAAGDVNGQAVGDAWWVVDAEGTAIEDAATPTTGASTTETTEVEGSNPYGY
jgi:predicted lipoprotein with Yx(FWY)xxD motif